MPAIVERLVKQLLDKGYNESKARAIAHSAMVKAGNITEDGKATLKGAKRGRMTPAQRAKDRAAKSRGGYPSDYYYNPYNNTAVKGYINKNVKRVK